MIRIITAVILIFLYLGLFLMMGLLLPSRIHRNRPERLLILGFLVYFTLFQIVALPMKTLKRPLKELTIAWFLVLLICLLICILFRRGAIRKALRQLPLVRAGDRKWEILFLAGAAVICLILGLNSNHISDFDAGYYIGLPVSSVYSNTIELMNPYTGQMMAAPNEFYFLNTFTIHPAVFFQALKVHPLIEEKLTMTVALSFLFLAAVFQTGKLLFPKQGRKALMFFLGSAAALAFSYSLSGISHYLAYRPYEGKSVTAYLLTTMIFLFFAAIFRGERLWGFTGMLLVSACGAAFCNTAVYVIPVMIVTLLLPYILASRKWVLILPTLLVLVPDGFWLLLNLLH